jgi:guanylate kinase
MAATSGEDIPQSLFKTPTFPVVVSGPSGVGKTSIVKEVLGLRPVWRASVSTTTRQARTDETDGIAYDFVSDQQFRAMREAGDFLETAEVHGNLYGTPKSRLLRMLSEGHTVLLNLDVQGGASLRRAFPDGVFVFIVPPSMKTLESVSWRQSNAESQDE